MIPRVLCVDDEPAVLDGLMLGLRRTANVTKASCVAEALQCLGDKEPFSVIISDMYLPGMNGSQLLSLFKKRAPLTQRILLTGAANLDVAVTAINSGEVFRFLVKPCPAELLRDSVIGAAEAYERNVRERDERFGAARGTLLGLLELQRISDRMAVARAMRFRTRSLTAARHLNLPNGEIELACLTHSLLQSLSLGNCAHETYQAVLMRLVQTSPLLRDGVSLLRAAKSTYLKDDELPKLQTEACRIEEPLVMLLSAACELDAIELSTPNMNAAFDRLLRGGNIYPDKLLSALFQAWKPAVGTQSVPLMALHPGMLLASEVRTRDGTLLLAKDTVLTDGLLERLLDFREAQLAGAIEVWTSN